MSHHLRTRSEKTDRKSLGEAGLSVEDYAARLDARPWPPRRDPLAAPDWASESCRLVDSARLYPTRRGKPLHALAGAEYSLKHRALAERRIREAGYRLAELLNQTLAEPL